MKDLASIPSQEVLHGLHGESLYEIKSIVKKLKMTHNSKTSVKYQSEIKCIREENRQQITRSRKDSHFSHLFFKRTSVNYYELNDDLEILTTEDVKVISKALRKKTEKTGDQLKSLIKGFSSNTSLVNAFLDEQDSMWSLVGYLTGKDIKLQIHALYCITNITSVDHAKADLVAKTCSPYLIAYLSSTDHIMQDLCATALGNIASDGDEFRKLLKVQGILRPLIGLLRATSAGVVESASFALLKLCAGSEETITELFTLGVGDLVMDCFERKSAEPALEQITWLILHLACDEIHLKYLLSLGLFDKAMELLHLMCVAVKDNISKITAILRLLGNAAALKDPETLDCPMRDSFLTMLKECLNCSYTHIVKESLWVMTNFIASEKEFAMQAINDGFVLVLSNCLNYGAKMQEQVLICLCTLASHGTTYTEATVTSNILDFLMHCLNNSNKELLFLALQYIELILRQHENGFTILEEKRTSDKLKNLANKSETCDIIGIIDDLRKIYFNAR